VRRQVTRFAHRFPVSKSTCGKTPQAAMGTFAKGLVMSLNAADINAGEGSARKRC